MTRKSTPSCSPTSYSAQMCGWLSEEIVSRLALEPLSELRVESATFRKDFDGDGAVQARVARAIDLAHAACTDAGDDLISAESNAGRQGHL